MVNMKQETHWFAERIGLLCPSSRLTEGLSIMGGTWGKEKSLQRSLSKKQNN